MSKNDKMKFIRLIEGSDLSISDALAKYDVPRAAVEGSHPSDEPVGQRWGLELSILVMDSSFWGTKSSTEVDP